jgi:hypothetical protein
MGVSSVLELRRLKEGIKYRCQVRTFYHNYSPQKEYRPRRDGTRPIQVLPSL